MFLFEAPTRRQTQGIETGVTSSGAAPLSCAQERLWFLDQLFPNTSGYNLPAAARIEGPLNRAILERSLLEIIRRHEVLRTAFDGSAGQPRQVVMPSVEFVLPLVDLSHLSELEREAETQRLATEETRRPFDLAKPPLFRGKLLRLASEEHVLLSVFHHIVSDGWSVDVFLRDLCAIYDAFSKDKPSPLPSLPIQYTEFARRERLWLQEESATQQLSYWKQQLRGELPVLELPVDHPRPPDRSYRGAKQSRTLQKEVSESVKTLSRRERVTPFMTLMTAFLVFLQRQTNQDELIVGAAVANRGRSETENLIGFFVNLVAIRADLGGNPTFQELLMQVRSIMLGAYAHQDMPFDRVVAAVKPKRDPSRNPLFQVTFVLQPPVSTPVLSELKVSAIDIHSGTCRFDLALFMTELDDQLVATWNYNTDLFDDHTITTMMNHHEALLTSLTAKPDRRIQDPQGELVAGNNLGAKSPEKRESKISGLRSAARKRVDLSSVIPVKTSRLHLGETDPLVVEPADAGVDLASWARHNLEFVDRELSRHGALLFRGFDVRTIDDFEGLAGALCPELFTDYGDLPRGQVKGRVYEATPYPSDRTILFHNESSHMHQWPLKQWFYCVQPAEQGGETPIADCRKLYRLLDPRILKPFLQKGIMYVRNFTSNLDVSWQEFFKTSDRSAVEAYCRKAAMDCEWKANDGLRIRHVSAAVSRHPKTGEPLWFNQIQHWHLACLSRATRESLLSLFDEMDLPRNCYYGDGAPIEDSVVDEISESYWQTASAFSWNQKDILMIDNMLVAHARKPYAGPRRIVVAMGDMISKEDPRHRIGQSW